MGHLALRTALATLVFAALAAGPASAGKSGPEGPTPEGQLLVVTTNLKEAFDHGDIGENSDMRAYSKRLLSQVPYVPDVLLVQEVRRSSAAAVAGFLSEDSGFRYVVAAKPGRSPWTELDDRIIDRETAVIINAETVEVLGEKKTITTTYNRGDANPGEPVRVRHHNTISVVETGGTASLTVASVHYVQNHFLSSNQVGERYKSRWVVRTANFLDKRSDDQGTQATLIGGDFNASRGTRDSQANHRHSEWLLDIIDSPFEFLDAVWEVTREGGPDFLLTPAKVVDAGVDIYYDTQEAQRGGYFYSDHRFRWALIETAEKGEPWEHDPWESGDGSF